MEFLVLGWKFYCIVGGATLARRSPSSGIELGCRWSCCCSSWLLTVLTCSHRGSVTGLPLCQHGATASATPSPFLRWFRHGRLLCYSLVDGRRRTQATASFIVLATDRAVSAAAAAACSLFSVWFSSTCARLPALLCQQNTLILVQYDFGAGAHVCWPQDVLATRGAGVSQRRQ